MSALLLALTLLATGETTARAETDPGEELARLGWSQLHDLDYDGALATFRDLQRREPDFPRAYLYQAVAIWFQELEREQDIEVSRFIDSSHFGEKEGARLDADVRDRFEALLERAQGRCSELLAQHPDDVETLYLLGSVHGVRASFEATVGHNSSAALKAARLAWAAMRSVVEKDPYYYDAYLTLGAYDYITGSLPLLVRWIAHIAGYRGDKATGIRSMELAARNGKRASRDARVILSVVYAREGRFEDAVQDLEELKVGAPHNHVLRLNQAWCLARLGRYREAARTYAEALAVARPAARFRREEVRLLQATALLQGGDAEPALTLTRELLEHEVLDPGLAARTKLVKAQALDALGRRPEALEIYGEVLAARNVDGSRAAARKGLKQPFVPATPADVAATPPG